MDREQIKTILPHREPMLLVDEVTLEADGTARGVYRVRGDEWFLQGHFPGNPVVPGVIQLEIMAQACALLLGEKLAGATAYYAGIDAVRFKRKVRPGEQIVVSAALTRVKGPFCFAHAQASVDGQVCCQGDLTFAVEKGR
jgi:3-hydroxyacyl-[acyl-carrier-protein] dehydratase